MLDAETHMPRPMYWGGVLFNQLVGETVYDTHEEIREGAHVYAFSRKDGKAGKCYIYVNNSKEETAEVTVPTACERYSLHADRLRAEHIKLNGTLLEMVDENTMPELLPVKEAAGVVTLAPATLTFLVTEA